VGVYYNFCMSVQARIHDYVTWIGNATLNYVTIRVVPEIKYDVTYTECWHGWS